MGLLSSIVGDRKTGDYNLEKKDYHQAIKYYDKALKKDPRDYQAWRGKGKALYGLGKFKKAYKCFEETLNINKIDSGAKKGKIDALLELGYEALDRDDFEQSIGYYQEVLEINHHDSQVFTTSSSSKEILRGRTSEILSGYLDEFLGIRSGDIEALRGIGWALYFLEEYENALNYFKSILRIRSSDNNAQKGKGLILLKLEQHWQALDTFNTILEHDPDDLESLKFRGQTLIELNNFKDALISFNQILKIDESDSETHEWKKTALMGLADQNLQKKQYGSARGYYDEYMSYNPLDSWALTGKMECLWFLSEESIEKHDYKGALYLLEETSACAKALLKDESISKADTDNLEIFESSISKLKFTALKELGHQYLEEEKFKESLEYLDSSLKISADNDVFHDRYQVLMKIATQCLENQKFQEGLDYYNQILQDNDRDYKALLGKAQAKNGLTQYHDALVILDTLLEYDDQEISEAKYTSLSGLGYKYLEKNQDQKALNYFKMALSIKSEESSLMGKALALNKLKRFEEALHIFENLLTLDPENKTSLKGKDSSLRGQGLLNLEKHDFETALDNFNAALKIDSTNQETLSGKARSLLGLGTESIENKEYIPSLEFFNQALDIEPKNLDALRGKSASLVEIGNLELFNDEFDAAIKIFNQAINCDPVNSEALKGKNNALMGKGSQEIVQKNYENALELFDEAAKIETNPDVSWGRYHALLGIGNLYLESINFESALDAFNAALKIQNGAEAKQGKIEALNGQGNLLLESNNHIQALGFFEEVLKIDPTNKTAFSLRTQSLTAVAQINLKKRDYDSALKLFLILLEVSPNDQQALLGAAQSSYYLENYISSLKLFERVLNQYPKDKIALHGKLNCHIKIAEQQSTVKEFEKSLDNYEKALTIELNNSPALKGKAFVLNQLGRYKDALEIFDIYLKSNSQDKLALLGKANAHVNIGHSYLEQNEFQSALTEFNRALSIDSNNSYSKKGKTDSLIGLGKLYLKNNDYEIAYREFNNALKIEPNDTSALEGKAEAMVGIGKHQLEKNQFNESLNSFKKVLKIDPENEKAIQGKFHSLLQVGEDLLLQLNYKEALDVFNSCLDIHPKNSKAIDGKVDSLISLGNNNLERKDYNAALKEFDLILTIKSDDTNALMGKASSMVGMGNNLLEQKKFPESLRFYNEALKIQPNNKEALAGQAKTLAQLGNNQLKNKFFEDALESFQKTLQIEPKNQEAIHGKANAYIGLGNRLISLNQPKDALKYLENALEICPDNLEIITSKGIALNLNGEFNNSIKIFSEVLSKNPDSSLALQGKYDSLVGLGKACLEKKEYDNAINNFEEALKINKSHKAAIQGKINYLVEIGHNLLKKAKYDKALVNFNQALDLETHNKRAKSGKVQALLGLGKGHLSAKRYDYALEIFGSVLEIEPPNQYALKGKINALLGKGKVALNDNDYQSALSIYEDALQINSKSSEAISGKIKALMGVGTSSLKSGKYEEAIKTFNSILDVQDDNQDAILGKIDAFLKKGQESLSYEDFPLAVEYFNKTLDLDPLNSLALNKKNESLLNMAHQFNNENNFKKAIEFYEEASKITKDPRTSYGHGIALFKLGEYAKAIVCFEDVLYNEKENIDAIMMKGKASYHLLRYKEAFQSANEVLNIDKTNESGWLLKIKILIATGRCQFALQSTEEALKDNPDSTCIWFYRGKILSHNKEYDEALNCINHALKLEPENSTILSERDKVKGLLDPPGPSINSQIELFTDKTEIDHDLIDNSKEASTSFVGGGFRSSFISKKIDQIKFGLLSPENIRKMSVNKIVTTDTYDEDGYPIEAGLMDPHLGVINPGLYCTTCGSRGGDCPGHFGHINLAKPVIHVGFADTIHKILRSTCSSCGKVLLTDSEKEFYKDKIKARIQNDESINDIIKEIYTIARRDDCPHCHQETEIRKNAEFMIQNSEEILEEMDQLIDANSKQKIREHIQELMELLVEQSDSNKNNDFNHHEKLLTISDLTDVLIRVLKGVKGNNYDSTIEIQEMIESIYQKAKRAQQRTIQQNIKIDRPIAFSDGKYKLTPSEVREWLEKIPEEDYCLVGINSDNVKPEWMVLTVLPVPPVTLRPPTILKSGAREEDDLTHKLVDILRINQRLKENLEVEAPQLIVEDLWDLLQFHVTTYFDNDDLGVPPALHRSGRPLKTLIQRLKGKEGRFRSNLSGKRVNFSARTVITPDPNISINEVGVPEIIATKVTVPVYVTEWNVDVMKKYIGNGSKVHPGANYVIRPDERKIRVYDETKESIRDKLEPGFVVERHLMDGDIVLFNRQPSLHRMSMMAHEVKVLPHKTFRLNPAVATPYNANFGGDLMNLHVLQNAEAIAEAKTLMFAQENFISPRFGGPIIGGIHDHISGGYLLTRDGSVFREDDVFQMVQKSQLPMPEPKNRDWTGKEIFSLLLPDDMYMVYKAEICRECDECLREECKNDAYVVIENGELKMGAIDEKAFGVSSGKILDSFVKEYGTDRAREFLDSATKLAISGIMKRGFTTSTADEEIPREARQRIEELLRKADENVEQLIEDYQHNKLDFLPGCSPRNTLEMKIMQVLGKARDKSGEIAKSYLGMDNHAVIMAITGARGSMLNLTQITACVGQQSVRGDRIERGYHNRALPHFKEGELGAKAGGFVHSSYKSGLDPLEFFFHAIGGRDVLVNREIRTAQSGYMQRRLIHALQDLNVNEDGTVRDNRGVVIQTRYGEDGINPAKSDFGEVADIDRLIEKMRIKAKAEKNLHTNLDNKTKNIFSKSTMQDDVIQNIVKPSVIPTKKVIGNINVKVQRITEKGKIPAQWEVFFDNKSVDFYSLGFYEPKNRVGEKQNRFSKEILNFKKEIDVFSNPTAEKFAFELIRMITKNHLEFDIIIPIPGSNAGKISNGHKRLTSIISKHLDILDGTGILQRVNSVKKSAWSGNDRPSLEEHYDSISCEGIVHNKRILLFDDVLTKGNTAAACVLKIYDNDPGDITIMTLGKTV